jgi:phage gp45-like
MESGPRGVDHITIPHEKMRESGWRVGDEVTFNWDGKRMILTKLPKEVAVSKVPAEVEISPEANTQQPEKTINIMATPATEEGEMDPRSVEYRYRDIGISARHQGKCPACNGRITGSQRTCQICGANLVR